MKAYRIAAFMVVAVSLAVWAGSKYFNPNKPSKAKSTWGPQAPRLIHGSGNEHNLNIVIVGDGFTADPSSRQAYNQAADEFVANLMDAPPFAAMKDAISVHLVSVDSKDIGIDVPTNCGDYQYANPQPSYLIPWARTPRQRNSALSTKWCTNLEDGTPMRRMIESTDEPAVWAAAEQAGVFPDLVIVLVNDWMFGAAAWSGYPLGSGSGGIAYVSLSRNPDGELNPITGSVLVSEDATSYPAVAVHEMGHLGPFTLLDEQGTKTTTIPVDVQNRIDASPNLTSALPPAKWSHLLTPGVTSSITPCPAPPSPPLPPGLPDAAASEGGVRWAKFVYHPRCDCRMNHYEAGSFCVVCRQRMLDALAPFVSLAQLATPAKARVIVDSVRTDTRPGFYYIDVQSNGSSVTGRWPLGTASADLQGGVTLEPGAVLIEIPPTAVSTLNYQIYTTPTANGSPGTQIYSGTINLQLPSGSLTGGGVIQVVHPSIRFTLGLVLQ